MFDIAWSELLVIGTVAVIVIGPKELPQVMRTLGRFVRRAQYMKFALSRQFDDFMREHDLDEIRNMPKSAPDMDGDEAGADEGFHSIVRVETIPDAEKRTEDP